MSQLVAPLPLNSGHLALVLASGFLNGIVRPPGEEPHVIRSTVKRVEKLKEEAVREIDDGIYMKKQVYVQKMTLVIRVLRRDGTIETLTE